MNTYSVVQILFGYSFENSYCETLSDLSCVWTEEMETYDFISFSLIHDNLRVAIVNSVVIEIPFERFIDTSISDNILCSEFNSSFFFTIAAATIFDRSEYSSGDVFITHSSFTVIEKTSCKKFACHDGSRGKFYSSMTDVSDRVDVLDRCTVVASSYDFAVTCHLNSNLS
jgi:hypothetical protein